MTRVNAHALALAPRRSGRARAWWRRRHELPLSEALRGGVVCVVPALLAAALHDSLFCWSAIAAFWTCLSDPMGADRQRRATAGLALGACGALGSWCAVAASAFPGVTVPLAGAIVLVAGLMRSRGAETGLRALLVATAFSVSAAFPAHGFRPGAQYASYFLAGNLWAVACIVHLWPLSRVEPVRRAALSCFSDMARFIRRLGLELDDLHPTPSWRSVPVALSRAQPRAKLEALLICIEQAGECCPSAARGWAAVGDLGMAMAAGLESLFRRKLTAREQGAIGLLSPVLIQLASLIEEWAFAIRADENAVVPAIARRRLGREIRHCRTLLEAMAADESDREFVMTGLELVVQMKRSLAASHRASVSIRIADERLRQERQPGRWQQFLRELRCEANADSPYGRYAVRLALGTMIAIAVSPHLPLRQGYWVVLTSLFVVQPNFSRTLQVSRLRVGGTILGASLASGLGLVFHDPLLLALTILPLAAGSLAVRAVSYVSYILFLTPHFILVAQLGLPTDSPWELAGWRIVDSTAGAALGVAITLILWPGWEKNSLASTVSRAIGDTDAYLHAVLSQWLHAGQGADPALAHRRRQACLAIDDVEATVDRMRLEPIGQARRVACGKIVLRSLRDITGAASLLESARSRGLGVGDAARLASFGEWVFASLVDDLRQLKNPFPSSRPSCGRWRCSDGACESFAARCIEGRVASAVASLRIVTRGIV